jgi:hypothetical protein
MRSSERVCVDSTNFRERRIDSRMGRYIKNIKGRRYAYEQTPYRVGDKIKNKMVYLGPVDGPARKKAADEKFRQVLRDNVAEYGKSRPGARYAKEAQAREQYHRDMGFKQTGEKEPPLTQEERYSQFVSDFWLKIDSKQVSPFEMRHREYTVTHASAQYRMGERFNNVRDEVHREDARQTAQDAPGRAQEAPAKDFTVDDEIEAREAKFETAVEEYNAGTSTTPDSPAPDDAPSPSGPDEP